ncbi:YopX family protein [Brevibacillus porteri]|uniref:YopX protein domain-containing protein n=1 Tax=Brevibacillus porteri TaxID=2126350 RepID=A0ABX5FU52_9BACL|nr:YopX family protein [Brevibacillus porteri]MED1801808.1 YopX family protein [Brevibacillus porteri]MED2134939.1 YopX family protein [Brevibacillus porteri]MED2745461.1 YopX family protein [Brevibacillus porteri]MED2815793.1 YopX family protein [Brevibacillus porteri]MED2897631.1 YopX family protein [Brevibacillus porteri]
MQAGRVIKFRAWDPDREKMMHPMVLNWWQDEGTLAFRSEFIDKEEPHECTSKYLDEVELLQYTGLRDRNGKEIYEGDIIKGTTYLYGHELKNGRQFDYFGVVEWGSQADVGLCWLVSDKQGSWNLQQTVHRNDIDYCTGEVIGNIYENPDLLEVGN